MNSKDMEIEKVKEQDRKLLFALMRPLNELFDLKGESIYLGWNDKYYSLERRPLKEMVEESIIDNVKRKFKQAESKHANN